MKKESRKVFPFDELSLPAELQERIEEEESIAAFSLAQQEGEARGPVPPPPWLLLPRLAPYLAGLGGILLGVLLGLISLIVGFILAKKF